MKTYPSDYMRDYIELAQSNLKMDVRLGEHMANGVDWVYELWVDGARVTWPNPVPREGLDVLTHVPAATIVGFLYALLWVGPDVVRDIVCEGYDHSIDHEPPEDHRT